MNTFVFFFLSVEIFQSRRSEIEDANQSIDDVIFGNGQDDSGDNAEQEKQNQREKKTEQSRQNGNIIQNSIICKT